LKLDRYLPSIYGKHRWNSWRVILRSFTTILTKNSPKRNSETNNLKCHRTQNNTSIQIFFFQEDKKSEYIDKNCPRMTGFKKKNKTFLSSVYIHRWSTLWTFIHNILIAFLTRSRFREFLDGSVRAHAYGFVVSKPPVDLQFCGPNAPWKHVYFC